MRTVYIVQEIGWEYNDEYLETRQETPVKAFASREGAEAYRKQCETEKRNRIRAADFAKQEFEDYGFNLTNTFGRLENITSLSESRFLKEIK